ncbi:L-2-hydroxyglutarate oxidase [Streptomyces sp. NBC_01754]|uniref:L-2-hydroxyglutarate oxidase n=1 Tax=Streptomyces sp. NBC_01754 TaxID=2975930 RepID=UPI002DDC180D|nr:L-2-hydroxyglutarate oxidase [Streptomyces sp. NBC_01754]WSC93881.1 L-2-hydroxyglutarate oxidase [Streptomyces sp. NBC_01754]
MVVHTAYDCDVLVIGGGIVGLSSAYALTRTAPGTRVVVLEEGPGPVRRAEPGGGTVHSGIQHAPGSLQARWTVRGAAELAAFCAEHGIAHMVTGKLVVATAGAELPRLHGLVQRGRAHGLPVRELGPAQIAEYEPRLRGLAAIRVGTGGVCDFAAVAARLASEVGAAGGRIRYGAEVVAVDRRPWGVAVRTSDGQVVRARVLVNCAGPRSASIARLAGDDPGVRTVLLREASYELAVPDPVRGLVHQVPDPALRHPGAELTRGLDGAVRARSATVPARAAAGHRRPGGRLREPAGLLGHPGSWRVPLRQRRQDADAAHGTSSRRAVARAVQRLLPGLAEDDLRPAPPGSRAQAVLPDGTPVGDFLLRDAPHAVHVLNTPPAAATAALPLGREVARRALLRADATGWRPPAVESGHCV